MTDGIALRTGNCFEPEYQRRRLVRTALARLTGRYVCNNPIHVPGPGDTVDINDPRIIKIYILPFNAFNNVPTGTNTDLPVIDFAAFYVTAWKYQIASIHASATPTAARRDNAARRLQPPAGERKAAASRRVLHQLGRSGRRRRRCERGPATSTL